MLSTGDRLAIEALHHAWLAAEVEGGSSAVLRFCTAAPVWLPPDQAPLCGTAAILQWLEAQPRVAVRRIDIDHLEIVGAGTCACKLATFLTTVDDPAESRPRVVSGSHGWLLQRDDAGTWAVAVVAWTISGTAVA